MEGLGIDKQDMIDPPEGAKPLCDLSTRERRERMEGPPRVDLLGADARPAQTALTIREPEEGFAAGAKGGVHVTSALKHPHHEEARRPRSPRGPRASIYRFKRF